MSAPSATALRRVQSPQQLKHSVTSCQRIPGGATRVGVGEYLVLPDFSSGPQIILTLLWSGKLQLYSPPSLHRHQGLSIPSIHC